jgi:hypothetical protein
MTAFLIARTAASKLDANRALVVSWLLRPICGKTVPLIQGAHALSKR